MTGIRLAKNLVLPVDVVTEAIAILARRGVGKTYTAKKLVEALVERWRSVLPDGATALLDVLLDERDGIAREELYEKAGYSATSSTPGSHLTTLRRNGLVDVDGSLVSVSSALYPS